MYQFRILQYNQFLTGNSTQLCFCFSDIKLKCRNWVFSQTFGAIVSLIIFFNNFFSITTILSPKNKRIMHLISTQFLFIPRINYSCLTPLHWKYIFTYFQHQPLTIINFITLSFNYLVIANLSKQHLRICVELYYINYF